jgi:hypothetical protein
MIKFQVRIEEKEFRALRSLAESEFRDHRQQAGLLIREALEHRGLLPKQQKDAPEEAREGEK